MTKLITNAQALELYGNPGTGDEPDPAWVREHIVTFQGMKALPGIPSRFYLAVHKDIADPLRKALEAARKAAPWYTIQRAGCFVFLRVRWDTLAQAEHEHRPLRPLSLHAWGIAIDLDPAQNSAHDFGDHPPPRPWSSTWVKLWPDGLPMQFVEAMEAAGFDWGGRWSLCDPMHFQIKAPEDE